MKKLFLGMRIAASLTITLFAGLTLGAAELPETAKLPNGKEIEITYPSPHYPYSPWVLLEEREYVLRGQKMVTVEPHERLADDVLLGYIRGFVWPRLGPGVLFATYSADDQLAEVTWTRDRKKWFHVLFLEDGSAVAGDSRYDRDIEVVHDGGGVVGLKVTIYHGDNIRASKIYRVE